MTERQERLIDEYLQWSMNATTGYPEHFSELMSQLDATDAEEQWLLERVRADRGKSCSSGA
jgi:hypothetical protein